jgi:hypothetical protein
LGPSLTLILIEGPEERRKEMRGRKEALWTVVISAALLTAGLILSCGDDNGNGVAEVSCQDVCEKLDECDLIPGILGETVEECEEACEEELAGANEGLVEAFSCVPDTDCRDIFGSCFCKPACEKLEECGIEMMDSMAECVAECEEEAPMEAMMCILGVSSCQSIIGFCFIFFIEL